ncbi:GntR family transcriptional regulator [Nocardioides sp. LHD-245]|uniref:GntR family transcriptional regulator n=1 Tax=Nocardioides sp. LHD-245 TaxID=3051387 RepID=UPI0027E0A620|nr:GntR family transcriptional regulator [Nocardioides sp. LHD-245]
MSTTERIGGELRHLQLKDRVYEHLRNAIIGGDFAIGAALREVDISTSLGVSKTPVREAFVRLQKDRFVDLIPYRGAVVAGYSRRDLREMYEVRELLEGRCAARAAEADDDQLRADLQRNVEETRQAVEEDRLERVIELFENFDRLIYSGSDNKWINDIIHDLDGHQRRIGRLTVGIPGRIEHSLSEHEKICAAILKRDAAAAEKRMRAHVRSVMTDQLRSFRVEEA